MTFDSIGLSSPAWHDARLLADRAIHWSRDAATPFLSAFGCWPLIACTGICVAARAGNAWLPLASVQLSLGAAAMCAAVTLGACWARDADAIVPGCTRAVAAAALCMLGALIGF